MLCCESSAPPTSGRFAKLGNLRLCSHKPCFSVRCGVQVSHRRHLVGSRNKVTFVSAHTKPAVLYCGVTVPRHRRLVDYRNEEAFVSAHTKPAVLCCGVRLPHHRCLFGLRNMTTLVSAHTEPAVLNLAVDLAEKTSSGLIYLAVPTHAGSAFMMSRLIGRAYYCSKCNFLRAATAVAESLLQMFCETSYVKRNVH